MVEHIRTHLRLHSDTDHVTPILHKIPQIHPYKIQKQKSHTADDEHPDVFVRDEILQHHVRHNRIQHTDDGNEQRCRHVQKEHLFMRLVIRNESFQHMHYLTLYNNMPLSIQFVFNKSEFRQNICVKQIYFIRLNTDQNIIINKFIMASGKIPFL